MPRGPGGDPYTGNGYEYGLLPSSEKLTRRAAERGRLGERFMRKAKRTVETAFSRVCPKKKESGGAHRRRWCVSVVNGRGSRQENRMAHELAKLFRQITAGVYVIGVAHQERRNAFTGGW